MIFWGGFHEVWEEAWQEADYLRALHCTNRQTWVASLQSLKDILLFVVRVLQRHYQLDIYDICSTASHLFVSWMHSTHHHLLLMFISISYFLFILSESIYIYNFMKNTVSYLGIVFGVLGQKSHAWESCIVLTKSFPYLSFLFVILNGKNSLQSDLSSPILGCCQNIIQI